MIAPGDHQAIRHFEDACRCFQPSAFSILAQIFMVLHPVLSGCSDFHHILALRNADAAREIKPPAPP